MIKKTILIYLLLLAVMFGLGVCSPAGSEPASVTLNVFSSNEGVQACTNDLGWEVTLTRFAVVVKNIEFTVEGETHASLIDKLSSFIVPVAYAHPGHYAGGDVTGELAGAWVMDFLNPDTLFLGEATLLEGSYNGMNLYFGVASEGMELNGNENVLGHSALIEGTAVNGDQEIQFEARIDIEDDAQMVGGIFEMEVTEETDADLGLQVRTIDPFENDTLFAQVDFGALEIGDEGIATIGAGTAAHNLIMKTLQIHDHWAVVAR